MNDQPRAHQRAEDEDRSPDSHPEPGAPVPSYRVRQPDGHRITVDLTTPGAFGDFAFTTHSSHGPVRFSAYHTGETAIFVDALTRYLADRTLEQRHAALRVVRDELDRIAAGRTATERGEDKFTTRQLGRPVDPAEPAFGKCRTSAGDRDLVLTPTTYGLEIAVVSDNGDVQAFSWPSETLWQLLAGMIWRSYAESGDDFSLRSRVSTAEYLRALRAAGQTS